MNIQTKYQGQIEIIEQDVIKFENGIPGFLEEKKFVVLPFADGTPFHILQSVQTSSLAFVVTDPFIFFREYDFNLSESGAEQLEIQEEQDVSVFVILTIQDPFEKSTANLQAPVIINSNKQRGKQIVLNNTDYKTKHLLIGKTSSSSKEEAKK
jgi:flagellar assembly factor FliW